MVCKAKTKDVLDLGYSFEEKYPLKLKYCPRCFHVQLSHDVCCLDTVLTTNPYVERGKKVLEMRQGVVVSPSDFDNLKETFGNFDVIVAQNVFAYVRDPLELLEKCKRISHENTVIYIQTSHANVITNNEFETVRHGHLSYFNTNSMKQMCEKSGLVLHKVSKVDEGGSSYLFEIHQSEKPGSNTIDVLYDEIVKGMYDDSTYQKYKWNALFYRNALLNMILGYKIAGYNVIGYGSTTTSNTLLNFCGIDNTLIDYIVDGSFCSPWITPGSKIPVKNRIKVSKEPLAIVVLLPKYYHEIKTKLTVPSDTVLININPVRWELFDYKSQGTF
jgi:SAM-dependent methyltransferase